MTNETNSSVTKIDGVDGAFTVLTSDSHVSFRSSGALKNVIMYPGDHYDVHYRPSKHNNCTLIDAVYNGVSGCGRASFTLQNGAERKIRFTDLCVITRVAIRATTEEEREAVLAKHRAIMTRRRDDRSND